MMGAYKSKIAPIIREYYAKKSKFLKANSSLEDLLLRYTKLIDHEIDLVMDQIDDIYSDDLMHDIVHRFTEALSRTQRKIMVQEILNEIGYVVPDVYDNLTSVSTEISESIEEYEDEQVEYLQSTFVDDYDERIRSLILDQLQVGVSATAIMRGLHVISGIMERKAENGAKGRTYSLYADLCEFAHKYFGFEKFVWITMKDGLVRLSHEKLHGKVFYWDFGAVGAGDNGQSILPGRSGRDGGDWGCRCIPGLHMGE